MVVEKKVCTVCGAEKDLDCFPKYRARGKEYRASRCKDCKREYNRRYVAANPDKAKRYSERAKVWRRENPDIVKEWESKKYDKHRAKILSQRRVYYAKNKQHVQAVGRKYRERNGDHLRALARAYGKARGPEQRERDRVRSRAARAALKIEVLTAYGGVFCACCNESCSEMLTLDHINNDGAAHRKSADFGGVSTRMYRWARQQGYPAIFRVMCYNCNISRAKTPNKICPHQMGVLKLAVNQ